MLVIMRLACLLLLPLFVLPACGQTAASESQGLVTIYKRVEDGSTGPSAGRFVFTGSLAGQFSLAAGQQRSFFLPAGSYSLNEQPLPGFAHLSTVCSDANQDSGISSVEGLNVKISLQPAERLFCTSTSKSLSAISAEPQLTASARLSTRRSCASRRLSVRLYALAAERTTLRVNGQPRRFSHRRSTPLYSFVSYPPAAARQLVSVTVEFPDGFSPPRRVFTRLLPAC